MSRPVRFTMAWRRITASSPRHHFILGGQGLGVPDKQVNCQVSVFCVPLHHTWRILRGQIR
jgi:hypothetical protein